MSKLLGDIPMTGTVLIVDDEETVRRTFGEILSMVGLQVHYALDGSDGIAQYRMHQQEIDVVLLDMRMPGISGTQTFELLREVDPQVKVILCSGYSEGTVTAQLEHNSLTAFLQKPVKIADLLNAIKSALATQV